MVLDERRHQRETETSADTRAVASSMTAAARAAVALSPQPIVLGHGALGRRTRCAQMNLDESENPGRFAVR
jgi:hypothetical protein